MRGLLTPLRALGLFVFGGLGGALMDQVHVRFGILSYARPALLGQAWWVAPNFGLATVAMYLSTVPFVGRCVRAAPAPVGAPRLASDAAWFVAAYLASGLFQAHPAALAAGYVAVFAVRMAPRPEAPWLSLHALGLALGGTTFEAALSSTGAFAYAHPDVGLVPLWLPGIYLHGAPIAMSVLRRLRQG